MSSQATSLKRFVETDLGVAETYRHVSKRVTFGTAFTAKRLSNVAQGCSLAATLGKKEL
jgi:hypothetical protein